MIKGNKFKGEIALFISLNKAIFFCEKNIENIAEMREIRYNNHVKQIKIDFYH